MDDDTTATETLAPPPETPDLDQEDRLQDLDKQLRWEPRSFAKRIGRAQKRLEAAKLQVKDAQAAYAEAQYKAHRWRWVPFVAERWQTQLAERKKTLDSAKALVQFRRFQVEKLQRRQRRHDDWQIVHGPELAERQQVRRDREAEIQKLGKEKLEELKQKGGLDAQVAKTWGSQAMIRELGELEMRKRVQAQRQAKRKWEDDWKRRRDPHQGQGIGR